jgi:hypothetical protein
MTMVEFVRLVVAERRNAVGAELLRRLRAGERRVSFDDVELMPLLREVELAEELLALVNKSGQAP